MLLALALISAKLIVMPPGSPALSIDYATMDRCERAKAELVRQDQAADHSAEIAKQLNAPVIVRHLVAYCIPA